MEITSENLDEEFMAIDTAEDDSGKNSSAGSSVVSDVDVDVGYDSFVQVTADSCRVLYPYTSSRGTESILMVCHNDKSCRKRMGGSHQTLQKSVSNRAKAGYYDAIKSRSGVILGGKPDTWKTQTKVKQLIKDANERILSVTKQMRVFDQPGSSERKKKANVNESLEVLAANLKKKASITPSKVKQEQTMAERFSAAKESVRAARHLPSAIRFPRYSPEEGVQVKRDPDEKPDVPDLAISDLLKEMRAERDANNAILAEYLQQMRDNATQQKNLEAEIADLKKAPGRRRTTSRFRSDSDDEEEDRYWGYKYKEERRMEELEDEIKNLKRANTKRTSSQTHKTNSGGENSSRGFGKRGPLYVIAKGHGGTKSVGFYRHAWYEIKFIVEHHSNARYCKVQNEPEGRQFIMDVIDELQIERTPQWLTWTEPTVYYHYPNLEQVRRAVEDERTKEMNFGKLNLDASSEEGDDGFVPQFYSEKAKPAKKRNTVPELDVNTSAGSRTQGLAMGVSASAGNRTQDPAIGTHEQEDQNNTIRIDESLGDDEKLFGLSINNRPGLIQGLAPKYMEDRTKRVFFSQLEDFTGYPRTQGKSNDLGESLKDLLSGARDIYAEEANLVSGFTDNGFRDNTRNVLLKIKTEDQLKEIINDLQGDYHNLLGIFRGNLSGILQQAYGHKTVQECDALAQASMIYRIGRDTLERYQSLLLHLHGTTAQDGWNETKAQLKFHGDKMAKIRTKYQYRETVLCKLYIYLRDAMNKNWSSTKLVQDQMRRLREQVTSGISPGKVTPQTNISGPEDSETVLQVYSCQHCKSGLHAGGRKTCPFKADTAAMARKKARQAMKIMADPNFDINTFLCQVTTDSLSDDENGNSNKKKDGKKE